MGTGSDRKHRRGLPRSIALVAPFPPPQAGMSNQALFTRLILEREGLRVAVCKTNHLPTRYRKINQLVRPILLYADCLRCIPCSQAVVIFPHYNRGFFAFTVPPVLLAMLFNKPVYYLVKGGRIPEFLERYGRLALPFFRRSEKIIVPSAFLAECFDKHSITAEILADIIDLSMFQGAKRDAPQGSRLLSARSLDDPVYGIDTIIKAIPHILKQHRDVKLTILGDGSERKRLTKLVEGMGLSRVVEFAGQVSTEEVVGYMQKADLLVNASLVDNYPNAILEAMAMGLPVVTTLVGGIPYLVEDGKTAVGFAVGDSQGLGEKVMQVLGNKGLYRRLSKNGREKVAGLVWRLDRNGLAEKIFK